MKSFHADNGSEFLNWQLYEYLTHRPWRRVPFTTELVVFLNCIVTAFDG